MSNRNFDPPYMIAASDWVRNAIAPSDDVQATTTDAEFEQLAVDCLQQAEEENAIIEGDLLYWLHDFREWLRAQHNNS
jgi:hypothetical protein